MMSLMIGDGTVPESVLARAIEFLKDRYPVPAPGYGRDPGVWYLVVSEATKHFGAAGYGSKKRAKEVQAQLADQTPGRFFAIVDSRGNYHGAHARMVARLDRDPDGQNALPGVF